MEGHATKVPATAEGGVDIAPAGLIHLTIAHSTMSESAPQQQQQPRPETHGSRTLTVNGSNASGAESASDSREGTPSSIGVLRLRGGPVRRNHVAWSSETIDNEGMGKKKSKSKSALVLADTVVCCIYHKPRKFDESSSESDSSGEDGESCCHGSSSSGQRTRPSGGGHAEEEASDSSSDGGAGDGSAR